jgi:alpha-1,6-rhamnosyltransferase
MVSVSVISPVYNAEATLEQMVETIVSQSFEDLELILVDDGSTDGTHDLAQDLSRRDPRIRLLQKENGGVGSARNLGLEHAKGKYVTFLDADDEFLPNRFEAHIQRLESAPNLVAVYGRFRVRDQNDGQTFHVNNPFPAEGTAPADFVNFMLRAGMFYRLDSATYRMESVGSLRFDTKLKLGQDFKFILEMASRGLHAPDNGYCATLTRGHESITRRRARHMYSSEKALISEFIRNHGLGVAAKCRSMSHQHVRFSKRYQSKMTGKAWSHALRAIPWNPLNISAYKHILGELVLQRSS